MRIRAHVLSIGLVAALAVSGCGAEDSAKKAASSAKDAIDPVAQAAVTTSAQKGGVALTMKGGAEIGGQKIPIEGSGVVDRAGKSGRFSFTTTAAGQSMKIDQIIDDRVIYMSSPVFSQLPGGKKWIKLDLDAELAKQGVDLDALGGGTTQDPAAALEYLKGAGPSKKLGTETINGTETTHYHVDADLSKVAGKAKDEAGRKAIEKLIQTAGTKTMPIDVWVDGQHLVRREKISYSAQEQGQKATFAFTMDFTKYGVDVDAKAPPAGEVADFSEVLGAAGGTTNG